MYSIFRDDKIVAALKDTKINVIQTFNDTLFYGRTAELCFLTKREGIHNSLRLSRTCNLNYGWTGIQKHSLNVSGGFDWPYG